MDEDSSKDKHKESAMKMKIFRTLKNLGQDDFKDFKWVLQNIEDFQPIKKSHLENADMRDTADLIIQTYTSNASQVMIYVLKEINRNDLLEGFTNIHKDVSDVGESSGSSLLTASSQPPQIADVSDVGESSGSSLLTSSSQPPQIADVSDVGESSGSSLLTASSQPPQLGLQAALQQRDFAPLDGTKMKTLLDRIEPAFIHEIDPSKLLPYLKDCMMDRDYEAIQNMQGSDNKGLIAASKGLTEWMRRTDWVSWFKPVKTALNECDFYSALRLLDPTDESLPPPGEEEGGEKPVVIKTWEGSDDEDAGTAPPTDAGIRTGEKKLIRKYQTELAQPVYEGNNTIICAPTGCGKTRVALAICEHHRETRFKRGQDSKVVFMATTLVLWEQQLRQFKQYFRQDVSIKGLCGDEKDNQVTLTDVVVENNDIIVLTPQILVTALDKKDITSLSRFSLLIFDECHNTKGKHPYNIIMSTYLDNKLDNSGDTQIVGLTASVGIGSFKKQDEAVVNICQLCANLNSKVISTVKENIEELESFVHTPKKELHLVEERHSESFISVIQDLMRRIETETRQVYDIDSLSSIPSSDYGSQKYEQRIIDIQQKCRVLPLDDMTEEQQSQVCRALYNYTEHLKKYNDALIINEDARTEDALDYLSKFMEQVKQPENDITEKQLTQYFDDQEVQLRELATGGQNENPKLSRLQKILQDKYRDKPDTKTLVFVRTRALTDILKRWIEETDSLKHLKPKVLIGRRRRCQLNASGQTTLNNRKDGLDSFKKQTVDDQSKLLIATSVAEEGIDLPQCNLVIMYEYVGNVVTMTQVRGRGRAHGSVCILLTNKEELYNKELSNIDKESIVKKAVQYIQEHPQELYDKMCVIQNQDRVRRQQKPSRPLLPVTQEGEFTLLCAPCRSKACSSDYIRVLECHHVVLVDPSLWSCAVVKPHPRPKDIDIDGYDINKKLYINKKLFCAKCNHNWGTVARFMNMDLPILTIKSFTVEDRRTGDIKLLPFRKWKDLKKLFTLKPFDLSDVPHDWTPLDQ